MTIEEYINALISEPWSLLIGYVIAGAVFLIGTAGR